MDDLYKSVLFDVGEAPRRSTSSLDDTLSAVPAIGDRGGIWRFGNPAAEAAIASLRASGPATLPNSYFALLRVTNGGEGDLGTEPGWFVPWRAEEVLINNKEYRIARFAPGLFGFGSNGGGECIAFDLRDAASQRIVMLPFIPMEPREVVVIAESFDQFALLVSVRMEQGIV